MAGKSWQWWSARVAVAVLVLVVVIALSRLWSFATADDPAVIERPDIAAVGGVACAQMRDAASAAAVGRTATVAQRVGSINAQNDAVITMVSRLEALGQDKLDSDQPAAQWVEDWQRLVAARDAYARSLAAGKPRPLTLPTIDGRPLVDRLNDSGINCRVPFALLSP